MARQVWRAMPYKGKEWGLFDLDSRCWVCFGTEREIKDKLKELEIR